MSLGSLIGFAAVFVIACTAVSLVCWCALYVRALRGPAIERTSATLAAALPVVLAGGTVAILIVESLLAADHCGSHGHHAHLCLVHGDAWLERGWAIALVAAGGAAVVARTVIASGAALRGHLLARRLRAVAEREGDVHVVASERAFSFVAGIRRPVLIASTGARDALDPDEWAAMLAHERAHVRHHDLRGRLGLEALLVFAAPLVGIAIRERWELATERLRDAEAATAVGSAEVVASALVRMARIARQVPRMLPAFSSDRGLECRVAALLEPAPGRPAGWLAVAAWTTGAALLVIVAMFADPLHHELETLLG